MVMKKKLVDDLFVINQCDEVLPNS